MFSKLQLAGGLAAIVAIGGFVAWSLHEHGRAEKLEAAVKGWERCAVAVEGKPIVIGRRRTPAEDPHTVCKPAIAVAAESARAAQRCSQALLGQGDVKLAPWVVSTACTAGVQRLYADRAAQARQVANLREQLADAEAATGRAVARAEARVRTEAERKARAQAERDSAPRDDRGRSRSDADRLRQRAEGWVAPAK